MEKGMKTKRHIAVVLCNLGGPDSLESVRPFLYNLFSDPAIIRLPSWLRKTIAYIIAKRRTEEAKHIYQQIGGKSPILENTQAQANAIKEKLKQRQPEWQVDMHIAMRYWHPRSKEVVTAIAKSQAEEIIFMPLYPQLSSTTTRSSLEEFVQECQKQSLIIPRKAVCCYPEQGGFIQAHVELVKCAIETMENNTHPYRILFSAHGLPEKIANDGDPYVMQVQMTVNSVVNGLESEGKDFDWQISYQSRVGPLAWVGPDTEKEIMRAAAEEKSLILVPIAFVSEHSETLVELDIQYKELAKKLGMAQYIRVPALGQHDRYIEALATMIIERADDPSLVTMSANKTWRCPSEATKCPCQNKGNL
jgi:ferrochelatase